MSFFEDIQREVQARKLQFLIIGLDLRSEKVREIFLEQRLAEKVDVEFVLK